jgi:hypothetical protein
LARIQTFCLFEALTRNIVDVESNPMKHRISKAAAINQFCLSWVYIVVLKGALLDQGWRQENVETLDR